MSQMVKNLPVIRGPRFNPWVRKISWRRGWHPTPVFLPGESHGQRSLGRLQSIGLQRVRHDWATHTTTPVRHKLSSSSFFLFFAQHEARGIVANRPRMEPMTPAEEVWSPNHWTTGEIPIKRFLMYPLPFIYRNVRAPMQPCLRRNQGS